MTVIDVTPLAGNSPCFRETPHMLPSLLNRIGATGLSVPDSGCTLVVDVVRCYSRSCSRPDFLDHAVIEARLSMSARR
jgi:hypothetical protein